MLVVNLYTDHFLAPDRNHPVRSAEDVWYATKMHAAMYERAARAIGLTPAEYREFQSSLLAGKYARLPLPHRLDAMSGDHRGHVYAVRNAVIEPTRAGWPTGLRVRLADGTEVYVPDLCGNLSVVHAPRVAYAARLPQPAAHYTMAVATTPIEQPVSVQAPEIPTPPTYAEAVAATHQACGWWCFLPLAGLVGLVHGHSSTPPLTPQVPPCNQGSNALYACSK